MNKPTVTYKGKTYLLLYLGATKFGERAHLAFIDGSKDFWVDASLVSTSDSTPSSTKKRSSIKRRSVGRSVGKFCAECGERIEHEGQQCWETGGTCLPD